MSFAKGGDFFSVGPFASASIGASAFSANMYYASLFSDYIMKHQQLLDDVQNAEVKDDPEALIQKQTELSYYDSLFDLTLSFNLFDELES